MAILWRAAYDRLVSFRSDILFNAREGAVLIVALKSTFVVFSSHIFLELQFYDFELFDY